ncbi:MAG: ATP-binding protein [Desulforhopalus sp.]
MKSSEFIRNNLEEILQEWDQFARSLRPNLDRETLRDHADYLLKTIADDIETQQTEQSNNHNSNSRNAAEKHSLDRFRTGYRLTEVIAEYKFIRATIIRLWSEHNPSALLNINDFICFNRTLDQQIYHATERFFRESKEELQDLNNKLEQKVEKRSLALQKAQAQYLHAIKLSAIGQLSASIAHEFNNPLQGIRTILKGLKRRAILDEEDKELLDLAIDENERMGKLIKSLQDFNQPSAGDRKEMDIHASLDSLLLLYRSEFKRKKIETNLNYAERVPVVEVIPDQIKQVFLNVLNNAKDACQQKGGVISISTCYEDQLVAVTIKDTGVGFAPEKKDEIFKPFYTTKPKDKGTGLGLSISKEIIEYHQGEMRVESQPGNGSSFTILLPVKKD